MILVNNPGSWGSIYDPLEHAPWHGLTPTDLVFPFFLFAVGNAMAFVITAAGTVRGCRILEKSSYPQSAHFCCWTFLTWWPFVKWSGDHLVFKPWEFTDDKGQPQGVRLLGVLPRIALCYFFAAIIVYYLKAAQSFLSGTFDIDSLLDAQLFFRRPGGSL